jgi:hypothetical protein
MKISKYEFDSQEAAELKIAALPHSTDEDGNSNPSHKHTIVKLGHIVLEQGEYNEEGEETKAPVLSDKYSVDVLWNEPEITTVDVEAVLDEDGMVVTPAVTSVDHPYGWKSKAIDLEDEGVHGFFGVTYQGNKL